MIGGGHETAPEDMNRHAFRKRNFSLIMSLVARYNGEGPYYPVYYYD